MVRTFSAVAKVALDRARARVHPEGWQSWSPTSAYRPGDTPARGHDPAFRAITHRDPAGPHAGPAGAGLLAVDPGTGAPVRLWAAADPTREVPEIRADLRGDRLVVTADGPVEGEPARRLPGGRAGRFWVNDPDCLIARPCMQRREDWAAQARYGGLRGSSDRLAALDDRGLAATRELLSTVPPTPFS